MGRFAGLPLPDATAVCRYREPTALCRSHCRRQQGVGDQQIWGCIFLTLTMVPNWHEITRYGRADTAADSRWQAVGSRCQRKAGVLLNRF